MSTLKLKAEFIWTKKPGDYPHYRTEDNQYFTYAGWMGVVPSNSTIPVYLVKPMSNKSKSEKFRFEVYVVPRKEVAYHNIDSWKCLSRSRYVLVEMTNPQLHRPPKLV